MSFVRGSPNSGTNRVGWERVSAALVEGQEVLEEAAVEVVPESL